MKPALVLVDLQNDFLSRPGLSPHASLLIERLGVLLRRFREAAHPVLHVQTQIRADGIDRMPHWQRLDVWQCVAGTAGAETPDPLGPLSSEPVAYKRFFSAFGSPDFSEQLLQTGADTLVVAGLYLHGCVRSTVMDAYERGYQVWVAEDAVGSTEASHAEISQMYLDGRAARFLSNAAILQELGLSDTAGKSPSSTVVLPAAHIDGRWMSANPRNSTERRNPANWSEVLAQVSTADRQDVDKAVRAAEIAQQNWQHRPLDERTVNLNQWAERLTARSDELAESMATEIGKPITDAEEELRRAISHVRSSVKLIVEGGEPSLSADSSVRVRFQPHGVVGLITPWNNPVAIPVGKIAPALAFGNGVVWKPAIEAPRTAMLLIETLGEAGFPAGLVNLLFGGSETARFLIDHAGTDAISLTASIAVGNQAAARCLIHHKPFQAELGGNNAAIVLGDCDLRRECPGMAAAAFSFAGQRCTSIQRFIVERSRLAEFEREITSAVTALTVGHPQDRNTAVGPVISENHLGRIRTTIRHAVASGGRLLCGGDRPEGFERGCWLAPTLLADLSPDSAVAQTEIFGPVAMIFPAEDLDEAIEIANGVPQGLVAALYTNNGSAQRQFSDAIEAGLIKLTAGPPNVHPDAPFGGWKASRIGPPEHGIWDREFYTRVQAVYD